MIGTGARIAASTAILALTLTSVSGPPAAAQEIGAPVTGLAGSVGLDQPVAVVLCRYSGDNTPVLDAKDDELVDADAIAKAMDEEVNPYYLEATDGLTSFDFIPISGNCRFDYAYNGEIDDPEVLSRELRDAVAFVDLNQPGIFQETRRLLVVVNRPKRNFAAWLNWPYLLRNTGFLLVHGAVIDARSMAELGLPTVAHELGHLLGLPDLYQEADLRPPRLVHGWGEMGSDARQNFTAYSRYLARWIPDPDERVITIAPQAGQAVSQTVTLGRPYNLLGHAELLRIDVNALLGGTLGPLPVGIPPGLLPFVGYYVEVRLPQAGFANLDAVLAEGDNPYLPGVLIFEHKDWLNAESGFQPRPLALRHRDPANNLSDLREGAHRVGDEFEDPDLGLKISIVKQNSDTSFDVKVTIDPPPKPDLVPTDIRLDSPHNGFNTFWSASTFGDPATSRLRVRWRNNDPFPATPILPPRVEWPVHRLQYRIANQGDAPASDVKGRLLVLEPALPLGADLFDPASLAPLTLKTFDISIASLPAGQSVLERVNYRPSGPFVAVVILDRNQGEFWANELNNARIESFLVVQLASGSPFEPLDLELEAINLNQDSKQFAMTVTAPQPLPEGWKVRGLKGARAFLEPGGEHTFAFRANPPLPDELPKPSWLDDVTITAWMNSANSMIPVMSLPYHYALSAGTSLTLRQPAKGKPLFNGLLRRVEDGKATTGIGGQRVDVVVTGSDRSILALGGTTNAKGRYTVSFRPKKGVKYAAVARYGGAVEYAAAEAKELLYRP